MLSFPPVPLSQQSEWGKFPPLLTYKSLALDSVKWCPFSSKYLISFLGFLFRTRVSVISSSEIPPRCLGHGLVQAAISPDLCNKYPHSSSSSSDLYSIMLCFRKKFSDYISNHRLPPHDILPEGRFLTAWSLDCTRCKISSSSRLSLSSSRIAEQKAGCTAPSFVPLLLLSFAARSALSSYRTPKVTSQNI